MTTDDAGCVVEQVSDPAGSRANTRSEAIASVPNNIHHHELARELGMTNAETDLAESLGSASGCSSTSSARRPTVSAARLSARACYDEQPEEPK